MIRIAHQILDTVNYLHTQGGLVHRDLRLETIFVQNLEEDFGPTVKFVSVKQAKPMDNLGSVKV